MCTAGTGKTTAVVEIILQEVARGNKVQNCIVLGLVLSNLLSFPSRRGFIYLSC